MSSGNTQADGWSDIEGGMRTYSHHTIYSVKSEKDGAELVATCARQSSNQRHKYLNLDSRRHWYILAAVAILIVAAVVTMTAMFLLQTPDKTNPLEFYQPMTGKSSGPEWSVADECNHDYYEQFKQRNKDEECRLVLVRNPRDAVSSDTAGAMCDAMGARLLYFDSVEEECMAAAQVKKFWSKDPDYLDAPVKYLWLDKVQYHINEQTGRELVHWASGHQTLDYPMRICKGAPILKPNSSWAMTFETDTKDTNTNYGCWKPVSPDTEASVICKICTSVIKGSAVAVPSTDLRATTAKTGYQNLRNLCSGKEHLHQYSLVGDGFLHRHNGVGDVHFDGLQPGCRYYQLFSKWYTYAEAVAQCRDLGARLLWFDSPKEECMLLKRLSWGNQTTASYPTRVWMEEGRWAKDSRTGDQMIMWSHAHVTYPPRMCSSDQYIDDEVRQRMTLTYHRTWTQTGLVFVECWKRSFPESLQLVICKRCHLPPLY